MVLFDQQGKDTQGEVSQMRSQGVPDHVIMNDLTQRGYAPEQVHQAISQLDQEASEEILTPRGSDFSSQSSASSSVDQGNIYERIEEITEQMIDERWDELIREVKKIVEWKNKIEEQEIKIQRDLDKLKEDFKILHQGVLGKLEDYDNRMQDVGTELKAVGKVFKDVIPEFVDNVKEFSRLNKGLKK